VRNYTLSMYLLLRREGAGYTNKTPPETAA
jgi:hypothetical protein